MMELAKRFLGKNCIIYYFDSQARGVITQVDDDAILIQTKRGEELLNLNFITRIMEYPSKALVMTTPKRGGMTSGL